MTAPKTPSRFDDSNYIKWARRIKERDAFTCQLCGVRNMSLHSHHINSWDTFISERYSLDNGITLCKNCHERFHTIYGKGFNTKYQFKEFRDLVMLIKTIVTERAKDGYYASCRGPEGGGE
jgi:5-methylcytosine-specific restriction endonuclease McrA